MPRLLLALLLVSFAGPLRAQSPSPSPRIQQFAEVCETMRRGTILRLEYKLRGLKSGHVQVKNRAAQVARIEKELSALRSGQARVVPSLEFPPQVGAIGRMPDAGAHVEQVLSPQEMLVTCYFPDLVTSTRRGRSRVVRVKRSATLLVRGLSTEEYSDGMDIELPAVYEITSRWTYRTTDGATNQVPVLQPFDMRAVEPYLTGSGRPSTAAR